MKISLEDLRSKIIALFIHTFTEEQSNKIADYIIWAEMTGNKTQGTLKLTGTEPLQNIKPKYAPKTIQESKLSKLIDAGANPAPLIATIATDTAIEKASAHGFSIVGLRNTYSSNGAQAYYAERIAKNNLIGIVCSRSPSSTTGLGSIDPLFGTNPIGFAFPTNEDPLVFDMATSAMTFYGLVLASARGEEIPEDTAIDSEGKPTTDPEEAMKGALLPFDTSYKGAGLGMVLETLAGPLLNSAWIDNETFKEEWGSTFIAIDPELLIDLADFKDNTSNMITKIKNSRTDTQIRIPGESSRSYFAKAEAAGYVEIEDSVAKVLGWSR